MKAFAFYLSVMTASRVLPWSPRSASFIHFSVRLWHDLRILEFYCGDKKLAIIQPRFDEILSKYFDIKSKTQ